MNATDDDAPRENSQSLARPTFYYPAFTQFQNAGDCVINRILLDSLRKFGYVIADDARLPSWYIEFLSLTESERSFSRVRFFEKIIFSRFCQWGKRASQQSGEQRFFILKPGHYQAHDSFRNISRHTLLAIMFFFFRILGVQTMRFGASIGPFGPWMRRVEQWKSCNFNLYGLRDSLSIAYANEIGIRSVQYSPDFAFFLPLICAGREKRMSALKLGLSFRGARNFQERGSDAQCVERLTDACDNLVSRIPGAGITFVAQVDEDSLLIEYYQRRLTCASQIVSFEQSVAGLNRIFSTYDSMDVLITNRLHGFLFSMSRGVIPIAAVDRKINRKLVGLIEDLGISELVCEIKDPGSVIKLIDEIANDATDLRSKINEIFVSRRALLWSALEKAIGTNCGILEYEEMPWHSA